MHSIADLARQFAKSNFDDETENHEFDFDLQRVNYTTVEISSSENVTHESVPSIPEKITKVDLKKLKQYEKKRKLRSSNHPTLDLSIWNYEETVHYVDEWDDITMMCRALVVNNKTGDIVARSFGKFFNYSEEKHTPTENMRIFDKADGSLGLLFYYEEPNSFTGRWIFTSRGSFISDQAVEGRKILEELYPNYEDLNRDYTYVFEIIYPENKIVINYGSDRKLIYLSSFRVDGTEHLDIEGMADMGFDVIREYHFEKISLEEMRALNIPNSEGFVILYDNGQRVKVKFEDYLKLHRLSTGLTNKKICELCCKHSELQDVLKDIPDELNEWVRDIHSELTKKANLIITECEEYVNNHSEENAKDFFQGIKENKNSKFISKLRNDFNFDRDKLRFMIFPTIDYRTLEVHEQGFVARIPSKPPATMMFLIGRSGSGKTTWTNQFIRGRKNCVRVNRDSIRASLYCLLDQRDVTTYYESKDLGSKERTVTEISNSIIKNGIRDGMVIIIDNTNLDEEFIRNDLKFAADNTIIDYKVFGEELSVDELYQRTISRHGITVPLKVIKRQSEKFATLLPKLPKIFSQRVKPNIIEQNPNLPECVVFDIDGTLALNVSGRSPYDMRRLHEDQPNKHIVELCKILDNDYAIIICSGRDETGRIATEKWLSDYGIHCDRMYMRKFKDNRKDSIVKEEFYRDIVKSYYITQMFDDRDQVVEHARELGFNVNQVAAGNF